MLRMRFPLLCRRFSAAALKDIDSVPAPSWSVHEYMTSFRRGALSASTQVPTMNRERLLHLCKLACLQPPQDDRLVDTLCAQIQDILDCLAVCQDLSEEDSKLPPMISPVHMTSGLEMRDENVEGSHSLTLQEVLRQAPHSHGHFLVVPAKRGVAGGGASAEG